jgi:hypothetical protein
MTYAKQTWTANVTPVTAVAMNHIEDGIVAASLAGATSLVYRYTVAGADKSSIDTGVDVAQAGSNDWTNGDLLEAYLMCRTDEAVLASVVNITFNNDTGANYDLGYVDVSNASVTGGGVNAGTSMQVISGGASQVAGAVSTWRLAAPNYTGTTFWKAGELSGGITQPAGARVLDFEVFQYHNTAAITRLKVTPNTAGKNLKVGSQLLIYKRLAS